MDNIDDILNNLSDYGKNILIFELIDYILFTSNYSSKNSIMRDMFNSIIIKEMRNNKNGRK